MASSFNSLAAFAAHLATTAVLMDKASQEALDEAAKIVEDEAERVIGTYDYGWPRLADATLARKAADTPLLETGEMRKSIGRIVRGNEAWVGSNDDKAVWHELGTSKVPPRSFLMGAATHKEGEVREILGKRAVAALIKS